MGKQLINGLLVLALVIILYAMNQRLFLVSPEDIRTFIYQAGWLAPLLFIFLFSIRPLTLFPSSVLSIVGGLAFGAWFGILFNLIGATIAAAVAFFVGHKFGPHLIQFKAGGKLEAYRNRFRNKGFSYILILRLLPVINFDLISYGAGISNVRFRDFIRATFIGMIPGTIVYNLLGASILDGSPAKMIGVALLYFVLVIVPLIWNRQLLKKIEKVE